jgi:hypothetical protein
MKISANTRVWLHGIVAGAIGSAATAGSAALAVPSAFNFTHSGLENFAKLLVIPAMANVFFYLSKSPLPSDTTATATQTVETPAGTQTTQVSVTGPTPEAKP